MTALRSSAAQPQEQPKPQPQEVWRERESREELRNSRNDSNQVKPSQNQIPQARTRNARTPAHMNKAQGRPAERTNNNEPDNSARAKRPGPRTKTPGPKGRAKSRPGGGQSRRPGGGSGGGGGDRPITKTQSETQHDAGTGPNGPNHGGRSIAHAMHSHDPSKTTKRHQKPLERTSTKTATSPQGRRQKGRQASHAKRHSPKTGHRAGETSPRPGNPERDSAKPIPNDTETGVDRTILTKIEMVQRRRLNRRRNKPGSLNRRPPGNKQATREPQ